MTNRVYIAWWTLALVAFTAVAWCLACRLQDRALEALGRASRLAYYVGAGE